MKVYFDSSTDASKGPHNGIIYRPGGKAGGNVYTDWEDPDEDSELATELETMNEAGELD